LTDAALDDLEQFTFLENLALGGPQRQFTWARVAKLPFLKKAVRLIMSGDMTDAELALFKDLSKIKYLSLNGNRITDKGLAIVKAMPELNQLDIGGNPEITDAGLEHLYALKNLANLSAGGTKVSADGMKKLAAALPQCRITGDGGTIEPSASPDADRKAAEWMLSIGGEVQVNRQGHPIAAVAKLPTGPIELIGVWTREYLLVTDADLARFEGCKNLTHLGLTGCKRVSDAGMARFKGRTNFTGLELNATGVGDAGVENFKGNTGLLTLNLGGTAVSDTGLAGFSACKQLGNLQLWNTSVTDTGLSYFKDCKSLTNLDLSNCKGVTDSGLAVFGACNRLTQLSLPGTSVSDVGLSHFRDCKNLTLLDLQHTKVTAHGVKEFAAAVPNCKIVWDDVTIEPKK
jgi:hypothetical protein